MIGAAPTAGRAEGCPPMRRMRMSRNLERTKDAREIESSSELEAGSTTKRSPADSPCWIGRDER